MRPISSAFHHAMARAMGMITSLLLLCPPTMGQGDGIDAQIRRLDAQIAQAAAEQDYAAAAGLQRDRNNWVELKRAVADQDAARIMSLQEALAKPYVYKGQNPAATASTAPTGTAPGPEFMHQVYTLEADGAYRPLEKHEARNSSSGGSYGGFGGKTSSLKVPGDRSNVRFPSAMPRFVVKTFPGQDPSDIIELVRLEVRGVRKDRYVDVSKSSYAFHHHSSSEVTDNRIRVSFTHIGDHVYEIRTDEPLPAGEYAFLNGEKVFAFGMGQ